MRDSSFPAAGGGEAGVGVKVEEYQDVRFVVFVVLLAALAGLVVVLLVPVLFGHIEEFCGGGLGLKDMAVGETGGYCCRCCCCCSA